MHRLRGTLWCGVIDFYGRLSERLVVGQASLVAGRVTVAVDIDHRRRVVDIGRRRECRGIGQTISVAGVGLEVAEQSRRVGDAAEEEVIQREPDRGLVEHDRHGRGIPALHDRRIDGHGMADRVINRIRLWGNTRREHCSAVGDVTDRVGKRTTHARRELDGAIERGQPGTGHDHVRMVHHRARLEATSPNLTIVSKEP